MILLADGTPDALLRMLNQRYSTVQKASPRSVALFAPTHLLLRLSARPRDVSHTISYQQAVHILP